VQEDGDWRIKGGGDGGRLKEGMGCGGEVGRNEEHEWRRSEEEEVKDERWRKEGRSRDAWCLEVRQKDNETTTVDTQR
jgi:hypothetical protein